MQTLLLQLTQLEVRAIDLVRASERTHETNEALQRVQAEVTTRQQVADEVIAELALTSSSTVSDRFERGES